MKENYKSFGKQVMECKDSGNLFIIHDAPTIKGEVDVLVCIKHRTYCHSKACIEERTDGEVKP